MLSFSEPTEKGVDAIMLHRLPCGRAPDAPQRHPRGASLNEETHWSRPTPWGKLGFGFAERREDCLSSILIAGPAW